MVLYVMERMDNQKLKGQKWDLEICPSITKSIESMIEQQMYSIGMLFQVVSKSINGIPFMYVAATMLYLNGNAEEYEVLWFKTSMFGSFYRYPVKPINETNMRRRMLGRSKVNIRKCHIENEGRHTINKKGMSVNRCGNCHQEGHNMRQCLLLIEVMIDKVYS
uniref:CCHC-type domain-containing protein n=1 Tax=Lactuca sativa TaxID=4236 RepID=A0A9R1V1Z0_LACSA|nr:hypothetical protein LSAT_V11C700381320 [Lactuca sativa]